MMTQAALLEILERISAKNGATVYISNQEITGWPHDFVVSLKTSGLISQASPAKHTICPGCERSCSMPVTVRTNQNGESSVFISCDKREDVGRVPISLDQMEQWQASGTSLANLLSKLLKLPQPLTKDENSSHWKLGVFRGLKHFAHVVLNLDGKPLIQTAGHNLAVEELLSFGDKKFEFDKQKIIRAVDKPAANSSAVESAEERAKQVKKRVNELRKKGYKDFIKRAAEELGVTTGRIYQLLKKTDES